MLIYQLMVVGRTMSAREMQERIKDEEEHEKARGGFKCLPSSRICAHRQSCT